MKRIAAFFFLTLVPLIAQQRVSPGLNYHRVYAITPLLGTGTTRLRFLFVAAKIWRHAGRVGVSYSDHYAEKGLWQRLMDRLRAVAPQNHVFAPVIAVALRL